MQPGDKLIPTQKALEQKVVKSMTTKATFVRYANNPYSSHTIYVQVEGKKHPQYMHIDFWQLVE